MTLHTEDPEADVLAKELARYTGESVTQAVIVALRERLDREMRHQPSLAEELVRSGKECSALPVLDCRAPDEILGYDDNGLPA